ncbi:MAG: 50S ribosomal protein L23, partial [Rickettsiaceae bacterium]
MSTLKRPIITEKATSLTETGRYVFEVERTANKVQIKKDIEQLYGVSVISINTMR